MIHQLWRFVISHVTAEDLLTLATIIFSIAVLVLAWWVRQLTLQDLLGLAAFLLSFITLLIVFVQLRLMSAKQR